MTFDLLKSLRNTSSAATLSREKLLALQEEKLRTLLHYAWDYSPFYREYWSGHNIKQDQLQTILLSELPTVEKKRLMEHYDRVVTDPRASYKTLEMFFEHSRDPQERLENEIVALHTSGSSGRVGFFLYSAEAWATARAAAITRVSKAPLRPLSRTRLAFLGATDGHYAGITLASGAPKALYKTLFLSVMQPVTELVIKLNAFQPNQLSGYASALELLAREQIAGRLSITPTRLIASGEPVSSRTKKLCKDAWSVEPINFYACTESACLAANAEPGAETLDLFEDLHVFEIVDGSGHPVPSGKAGLLTFTNLYNPLFPLIRYQMEDIVREDVRTKEEDVKLGGRPWRRIFAPLGRSEELMWFQTFAGTTEFLHPLQLAEFFVPGLKRFQFVRHGIRGLTMRVELSGSPDTVYPKIERRMDEILAAKKLTGAVDFRIESVRNLPFDPKTGKFKLIVMEMPS